MSSAIASTAAGSPRASASRIEYRETVVDRAEHGAHGLLGDVPALYAIA